MSVTQDYKTVTFTQGESHTLMVTFDLRMLELERVIAACDDAERRAFYQERLDRTSALRRRLEKM